MEASSSKGAVTKGLCFVAPTKGEGAIMDCYVDLVIIVLKPNEHINQGKKTSINILRLNN